MDRFGPTGKVSKNWSSFWGGPLFPVGPVWILDEWKASLVLVSCEVSRKITRDMLRHFHGLYSHWPWLSTNQRARIRSVVVQKSIDTSLWRHTATRLANRTMPSPYYGFLRRENARRGHVFIHWPIKHITNTYWNHFSRSYENRSNNVRRP